MEENDLALLMTGLFLLVIVFGRIAWQFKLSGNSGVRLSTKLKTMEQRVVGSLFFALLAIQGVLAWAYAMSYLSPLVDFANWGIYTGLTLCIGGILLASYCQFEMKEEWRIGVDPDEQTRLVTTGVYSYIRNPIYTACIVYGTGIIVLAPHAATFITGLAGFFAIHVYVKKIEEPYLLEIHGEAYLRYIEKTGSYLPRV